LTALVLGLWLLSCHTVLANDANRYAFTVNAFDNSLTSYRVAADGLLYFNGFWPLPAFPAAVGVDPSGHFVMTTSKSSARIGVFRIDTQSGVLTPAPGSPFRAVGRSPFFVRFHPSGKFVYIASRFDGVLAFAFDPDSGALSPLKGMPYPSGERTRSLTIHPSGRFLYASNAYSNTVSAFAIDQATGQLTPLAGSPFPAGDVAPIDSELVPLLDYPPHAGGVPYYVAMHPSGRFLYVSNWGGGSLSAFRIDEQTGALSLLKGFPRITGVNPYALAVHPSGRFLYVTSWADNALWAYGIDPTSGDLTLLPGSPFAVAGKSPVAISFDPAGGHAYVPNFNSNNVSVFTVNTETGSLHLQDTLQTRSGPWSLALTATDVPAPPITRKAFALAGTQLLLLQQRVADGALLRIDAIEAGSQPIAVTASHDGRRVFVADAGGDRIHAFRVEGERLVAVTGSPFAAGKGLHDLALGINGRYLYAINEGDSTFTAYAIDSVSGALSPVSDSSLRTGKGPVAVTVGAATRYALVANAAAGTVSVFRYQSSHSPLVYEIGKYGSPFAVGKRPVALAEDPTGKHLYVVNAGDASLDAFSIDPQSGVLVAVPGSPFATGKGARAVTVHPSGDWVFVLNGESRDVVRYRRDRLQGTLREVLPRIPLAEGGKMATGLRLDPDGRFLYLTSIAGKPLGWYAVDAKSGGLTRQKTAPSSEGIKALTFPVFSR